MIKERIRFVWMKAQKTRFKASEMAMLISISKLGRNDEVGRVDNKKLTSHDARVIKIK